MAARRRRNARCRRRNVEETHGRIEIVGLVADVDFQARILAPIVKAKVNVAELIGLTIPRRVAVRIGAVQPNTPLLSLAKASADVHLPAELRL